MLKGFAVLYGTQLYKQLSKRNFDILHTFKFYSKWKASLQLKKNSIIDEQPWITFPVISILDKYVNSSSKVFEYGGGGSTLFFVNRAHEVVTVEHNNEWFMLLQDIIKRKNIGKWNGNLVFPEANINTALLNPSKPKDYFSKDPAFATNTFLAYARFIDKYPDEYFDVVLVDGRARPSCAWQSVTKLKKGGYLVIDNSDREYYFAELRKTLETDFKLIYNKIALSPYVKFFTKTGVWEKL